MYWTSVRVISPQVSVMSSVNMIGACIQLSALGVDIGPSDFTYTSKDAILYALGGMSLTVYIYLWFVMDCMSFLPNLRSLWMESGHYCLVEKMEHKCWCFSEFLLPVGVSTQDEDGLRFLYENSEDFSPLPTFTVIPSQAAIMSGGLWSKIPNWSPDFTKVFPWLRFLFHKFYSKLWHHNNTSLLLSRNCLFTTVV